METLLCLCGEEILAEDLIDFNIKGAMVHRSCRPSDAVEVKGYFAGLFSKGT
jgi:hypothetical protein